MTRHDPALSGQSALVTGSTSGIGLGIATALAEAGVDVMLNGFGEASDIERMRGNLTERTGVRVLHSSADMSRPEEIVAMVCETETSFGRLDILVNNAGIQFVAAIADFPPDQWDRIISVNLSSNFHSIKAALPGMRARNAGRIVNIASAHGLVASPFKGAYVAAKHGVVGLTKTVALEMADTAVTCNAICPGFVRTPLVTRQRDELAEAHHMTQEQVIRDVILASQPNKRFVEVRELAAMVLFLCSTAGASITGSALSVDGGWTAR
jgi:3-hydroxybutyrate dehydrogenase